MSKFKVETYTKQVEALYKRLRHMGQDNPTHNQNIDPYVVAFCGLAVLFQPGAKVRLFHDALPYGRLQFDAVDLKNAMANLGFVAHADEGILDDADGRLLPALFVPYNEAQAPLVLLKPDSTGQVLVLDCATMQVRSIQHAELATEGSLYTFKPAREDEQLTSSFVRQATGFGWFRALVSRFGSLFRVVMVTGVLLNILGLAIPIFIMLVYDRVIAAGAVSTLYALLPGVLLALVFEWALRSLRGRALAWLASRLDALVGNAVYAQLLQLPASFVEQASVAAQIARLRTFEYLRDFFSGPVFLSMVEMPFMLLALMAIGLIAGKLVLVPLLLSGVYMLLFIVFRRKVRVAIRRAARASSARQQFAMEAFEKLEHVRSAGLTDIWAERFRKLSGEEYLAHFKLNQMGSMAEILAHMLTVTSAVAVITTGINQVWAGQLSAGALVATMILVWRVLTPLYGLCAMILRIEQLTNSIRQVNTLMDMETEYTQGRSRARLKKVKGSLAFHEVGLQYESAPDPVFSQLTFAVTPGSVVVITGPSGSGKSSVLKLVQRLYDPTQGSITLDGFDLRQLDAVDMRRQIAYVPQKPDFFEGTIAENLRLAQPAATEAELWVALRMADAAGEVSAMADGLNTMIASARGVNVSENLAFQLGLARAYLQNANLVLIDELPNVLLDGKTGHLLRAYIERAKGKRTMVLATHRPDFLQFSDVHVVLRPRGPALTVIPSFQDVEEEGKAHA